MVGFQKQLPENWRPQKAVIFVIKEAITLGNEKVLDHSRRFLHIQINERDKPCFSNCYMGNLG